MVAMSSLAAAMKRPGWQQDRISGALDPRYRDLSAPNVDGVNANFIAWTPSFCRCSSRPAARHAASLTWRPLHGGGLCAVLQQRR